LQQLWFRASGGDELLSLLREIRSRTRAGTRRHGAFQAAEERNDKAVEDSLRHRGSFALLNIPADIRAELAGGRESGDCEAAGSFHGVNKA
jgi:hypothetical protein